MNNGGVRITVLGEIGVGADQQHVAPLTAPLPRALLARLCTQPNEPVSTDALVDAAWPGGAPRSVRTALQTHVSSLRDFLEPERPRRSPGSYLATAADGYVLRVRPEQLDSTHFERLVSEARACRRGDAVRAAAAIAEALASWSDPPFAELGSAPWALGAVARLGEARRSAGELRFGLALEAGRDEDVVGELAHEIERFPFDERLVGQLMFALYRTGRQEEALDTYRDARRRLIAELGIEPGEQLRRLEHQILSQDVALQRSPRTDRSAPSGRRRSTDALVGRASELDVIAHAVQERRLVTLVGPGGCGKTRLAHEIVERRPVADARESVIVELAPVVDGDVARAVARALGLVEQPFHDVIGQLVDAMRAHRFLLVLDNCEHVVGEVAAMVARLTEQSEVVILSTSRAALGTAIPSLRETVVEIEPLGTADSIELLELHAGRTFDDGERAASLELIRRLDGLPLALELAARRLTTISVAELVTIADRPGAISGPADDERHGTIERTIRSSTDLLSDAQAATLFRVAVFAGRFVLEAAEQLITDDDVGRDEVLDLLTELAGRSLLVVERHGDRTWFRMLETVRTHLRSEMRADGDLDRWQQRHAEWVHDAIRQTLRQRRSGADSALPLDSLSDEVGAALGWIELKQPGGRNHLRLVTGLALYWHETGRVSEGRDRLRAALAADVTGDPILRAIALADAGSLAWWQGGFRELDEVATEAISLARSAGASDFADLLVAARAVVRRDFDNGAHHLQRALSTESLSRGTELALLHVGGDIEWYRGNHVAAAGYFEREVSIGAAAGSDHIVAQGQRCQGLMLAYAGRAEHGWSLCLRALEAAVESGSELSLAQSHAHCAAAAHVIGDGVGARSHAEEALRRSVRQFDVRAILVAMPVLARTLADQGDLDAVARLTGWLQAMRDETGVFPPPPGKEQLDSIESSARDATGARWGALRAQGAGWRLSALVDAVIPSRADPGSAAGPSGRR